MSPAIGGAPPPLLLTGERQGETFLDRAIATLRGAGITRILVEVAHLSGPVAARARRAGAELIQLPDSADLLAPGTVVAVLSPSFPLVQSQTLLTLLAVLSQDPGDPLAWPADVVRIVPRTDPPADGSPDREVAPLLARAPFPRKAGPRWTPVDHGLLRIPVKDPGIHLRVDSVSAYRRHFPAAYRRRFQKW